MGKKTKIFLVSIFCLGALTGLSIGLVKASNPDGEISGGEQPASTWYDEHWQAATALVGTASGYVYTDISGRATTAVAAQISANSTGAGATNVVSLHPKMVVTKWKVHGHIHFE